MDFKEREKIKKFCRGKDYLPEKHKGKTVNQIQIEIVKEALRILNFLRK